ncbi:hypothetical protein G6F33_001831 [Rhizopus arrhizus]|uniref:Uncharacterized protein n=1 Tax=Rhizopus oryzae TaxID=64495 RepID=A0A9P7BNR1_RHIOR|nr:hypothetical protein G6F23_010055 [Rhizopus arrhizus]KAG0917058.1 hypothetical protein G6F33_001831 [Rhizopus arrhizus]KAG0956236.1 hypothetical protein G6F32_002198 [Rhizopus arrhizus]KAG1289863.1 hypothetical protein G6F66_009137 [Rhizopus arrhizus]KAG1304273.1 hypothetical protein G6F64_009345 [Rhizopus arrhizus]
MHLSGSGIVASLFLVATSFVNAASNNSGDHPLTTIKSQDNFCIFLPPKPGLEVAVNENNGIPFCSNKNAVPKATVFPTGFITTAHYLKTSKYVQVTGFFDRSKYNLGESDGGGQYDNHAKGKPVGAQCEGYNYFVNLIEPDIERFCIRCCKDKADCNTGRSGYGCLRVVSGDYTRDNNMVSNSTSSKKKSHNHSNSNFNSVLAELDELPTTATHMNEDDSNNTALNELGDLTSSISAIEKISSEIETLKTKLSNEGSVDQVKSEWATFTSQLSQDYPDFATDISKLTAISSVLTTSDQWSTYFDLVSSELEELNNVAATITTDSSATLTHTNTQEELDWLYNHRESHDNQATCYRGGDGRRCSFY